MNVAGLQFLPPSAFLCCAVSANALRETARRRNGFRRAVGVVSPAHRIGYARSRPCRTRLGSRIASRSGINTMRMTTLASRMRLALLLIATLGALHPATARGQSVRSGKLAPVLQVRADHQITGRSRVIVQFRGTPDTRVITGSGGVAGRQRLPDRLG